MLGQPQRLIILAAFFGLAVPLPLPEDTTPLAIPIEAQNDITNTSNEEELATCSPSQCTQQLIQRFRLRVNTTTCYENLKMFFTELNQKETELKSQLQIEEDDDGSSSDEIDYEGSSSEEEERSSEETTPLEDAKRTKHVRQIQFDGLIGALRGSWSKTNVTTCETRLENYLITLKTNSGKLLNGRKSGAKVSSTTHEEKSIESLLRELNFTTHYGGTGGRSTVEWATEDETQSSTRSRFIPEKTERTESGNAVQWVVTEDNHRGEGGRKGSQVGTEERRSGGSGNRSVISKASDKIVKTEWLAAGGSGSGNKNQNITDETSGNGGNIVRTEKWITTDGSKNASENQPLTDETGKISGSILRKDQWITETDSKGGSGNSQSTGETSDTTTGDVRTVEWTTGEHSQRRSGNQNLTRETGDKKSSTTHSVGWITSENSQSKPRLTSETSSTNITLSEDRVETKNPLSPSGNQSQAGETSSQTIHTVEWKAGDSQNQDGGGLDANESGDGKSSHLHTVEWTTKEDSQSLSRNRSQAGEPGSPNIHTDDWTARADSQNQDGGGLGTSESSNGKSNLLHTVEWTKEDSQRGAGGLSPTSETNNSKGATVYTVASTQWITKEDSQTKSENPVLTSETGGSNNKVRTEEWALAEGSHSTRGNADLTDKAGDIKTSIVRTDEKAPTDGSESKIGEQTVTGQAGVSRSGRVQTVGRIVKEDPPSKNSLHTDGNVGNNRSFVQTEEWTVADDPQTANGEYKVLVGTANDKSSVVQTVEHNASNDSRSGSEDSLIIGKTGSTNSTIVRTEERVVVDASQSKNGERTVFRKAGDDKGSIVPTVEGITKDDSRSGSGDSITVETGDTNSKIVRTEEWVVADASQSKNGKTTVLAKTGDDKGSVVQTVKGIAKDNSRGGSGNSLTGGTNSTIVRTNEWTLVDASQTRNGKTTVLAETEDKGSVSPAVKGIAKDDSRSNPGDSLTVESGGTNSKTVRIKEWVLADASQNRNGKTTVVAETGDNKGSGVQTVEGIAKGDLRSGSGNSPLVNETGGPNSKIVRTEEWVSTYSSKGRGGSQPTGVTGEEDTLYAGDVQSTGLQGVPNGNTTVLTRTTVSSSEQFTNGSRNGAIPSGSSIKETAPAGSDANNVTVHIVEEQERNDSLEINKSTSHEVRTVAFAKSDENVGDAGTSGEEEGTGGAETSGVQLFQEQESLSGELANFDKGGTQQTASGQSTGEYKIALEEPSTYNGDFEKSQENRSSEYSGKQVVAKIVTLQESTEEQRASGEESSTATVVRKGEVRPEGDVEASVIDVSNEGADEVLSATTVKEVDVLELQQSASGGVDGTDDGVADVRTKGENSTISQGDQGHQADLETGGETVLLQQDDGDKIVILEEGDNLETIGSNITVEGGKEMQHGSIPESSDGASLIKSGDEYGSDMEPKEANNFGRVAEERLTNNSEKGESMIRVEELQDEKNPSGLIETDSPEEQESSSTGRTYSIVTGGQQQTSIAKGGRSNVSVTDGLNSPATSIMNISLAAEGDSDQEGSNLELSTVNRSSGGSMEQQPIGGSRGRVSTVGVVELVTEGQNRNPESSKELGSATISEAHIVKEQQNSSLESGEEIGLATEDEIQEGSSFKLSKVTIVGEEGEKQHQTNNIERKESTVTVSRNVVDGQTSSIESSKEIEAEGDIQDGSLASDENISTERKGEKHQQTSGSEAIELHVNEVEIVKEGQNGSLESGEAMGLSTEGNLSLKNSSLEQSEVTLVVEDGEEQRQRNGMGGKGSSVNGMEVANETHNSSLESSEDKGVAVKTGNNQNDSLEFSGETETGAGQINSSEAGEINAPIWKQTSSLESRGEINVSVVDGKQPENNSLEPSDMKLSMEEEKQQSGGPGLGNATAVLAEDISQEAEEKRTLGVIQSSKNVTIQRAGGSSEMGVNSSEEEDVDLQSEEQERARDRQTVILGDSGEQGPSSRNTATEEGAILKVNSEQGRNQTSIVTEPGDEASSNSLSVEEVENLEENGDYGEGGSVVRTSDPGKYASGSEIELVSVGAPKSYTKTSEDVLAGSTEFTEIRNATTSQSTGGKMMNSSKDSKILGIIEGKNSDNRTFAVGQSARTSTSFQTGFLGAQSSTAQRIQTNIVIVPDGTVGDVNTSIAITIREKTEVPRVIVSGSSFAPQQGNRSAESSMDERGGRLAGGRPYTIKISQLIEELELLDLLADKRTENCCENCQDMVAHFFSVLTRQMKRDDYQNDLALENLRRMQNHTGNRTTVPSFWKGVGAKLNVIDNIST